MLVHDQPDRKDDLSQHLAALSCFNNRLAEQPHLGARSATHFGALGCIQ